MCVILETLRFGLEDSTWWKGRGAEGRHLETVPWKEGREGGREGGDGQWRTVDRFWGGKEGRENDRFWINDHSLQESISRRLYLERGNGN